MPAKIVKNGNDTISETFQNHLIDKLLNKMKEKTEAEDLKNRTLTG
jgi:hypothetical protein